MFAVDWFVAVYCIDAGIDAGTRLAELLSCMRAVVRKLISTPVKPNRIDTMVAYVSMSELCMELVD